MSDFHDYPPAARDYLLQLRQALSFAPRYAAEVCSEVGDHFMEAIECSDQHPDSAALNATQRFGSPLLLAAEFSTVLITRKLRHTLLLNMAVMVVMIVAVFSCFAGRQGGAGAIAACLSGAVAWSGLLLIQRNQLSGAQLYHWLCTPMIACQITCFVMILGLVWNLTHFSGGSPLWALFDVTVVAMMALRMLHLRHHSRRMCLLWRQMMP